jgi:deoxycytidylate deaminase
MSRQEVTGRIKRFIDLAYRVAQTSDFDDYRHGAVLVRGNNVINVSANKNSLCSFWRSFS